MRWFGLLGFFQEIGILFPVLNALIRFIFCFTCVDYTPETLLVWPYFEFPDFSTGARKLKQNSLRQL